MMWDLNICHLYPDLLNLYGDRGNILALKRRCEWRGISVQIRHISIGDAYVPEEHDLVFLGGGQDYEQEILQTDFLMQKGNEIKNAVSNHKVFLAICGGYQLMGNDYKTWDGKEIEFLGALDIHTVGAKDRIIGNFVFCCDFLKNDAFDGSVVGFENHSGRTFLGPLVKPLGRVLTGGGNNGQDGTEGAIFHNVYCSYAHGSLLPKNPALTDHLISLALKQKYTEFDFLEPLDDAIEESARLHMQNTLKK
jgi:lipid II isoglutaminyl synthase (glutamine-hydrolysing)